MVFGMFFGFSFLAVQWAASRFDGALERRMPFQASFAKESSLPRDCDSVQSLHPVNRQKPSNQANENRNHPKPYLYNGIQSHGYCNERNEHAYDSKHGGSAPFLHQGIRLGSQAFSFSSTNRLASKWPIKA